MDISQINNFKQLEQKDVILNKREISLLKEAKSYTEEIRRLVKTDYGFKKLYSEGLSITSPLNGKYQIAALNALRYGIESYDKRHGWRGPITNTKKNTDWKNKLKSLEIDETLNWEIAEVTNIDEFVSEIKILKIIKLQNFFSKT